MKVLWNERLPVWQPCGGELGLGLYCMHVELLQLDRRSGAAAGQLHRRLTAGPHKIAEGQVS